MTNQDFINLQTALGLSGKELADKLGVTPAAVSKWRTEREIPPYIAKAMEKLIQEVEIVVPLNVLVACSRAAEAQGITFERFLGNMLKEAASSAPMAQAAPEPGKVVTYPNPEPDGTARIADDTGGS